MTEEKSLSDFSLSDNIDDKIKELEEELDELVETRMEQMDIEEPEDALYSLEIFKEVNYIRINAQLDLLQELKKDIREAVRRLKDALLEDKDIRYINNIYAKVDKIFGEKLTK